MNPRLFVAVVNHFYEPLTSVCRYYHYFWILLLHAVTVLETVELQTGKHVGREDDATCKRCVAEIKQITLHVYRIPLNHKVIRMQFFCIFTSWFHLSFLFFLFTLDKKPTDISSCHQLWWTRYLVGKFIFATYLPSVSIQALLAQGETVVKEITNRNHRTFSLVSGHWQLDFSWFTVV